MRRLNSKGLVWLVIAQLFTIVHLGPSRGLVERIAGLSIRCDRNENDWHIACHPYTHGGLGVLNLFKIAHALRLRWFSFEWKEPNKNMGAYVGELGTISTINSRILN